MRLGAGIRVKSFRRRTALDFRRAQKSCRDAGARIQGCACALRTDEQNDHVGPNQWPSNQFAGRQTGSNQLILDAEAAELFGVTPSPRGLLYIRSTKIQGQTLPVGFVQNMSAGSMNFGSSLVTLRRSSHADGGGGAFDGVLGLDILFRHKALINCRTKLVFFKVDQARRINLGSVAASEKFTRVPIRREETGALTVPFSIRGQPTRLLVDTGAFVTILHENFVKIARARGGTDADLCTVRPRRVQRLNAARLDDFNIGAFKMPPAKIGVTPLPQFALQQGSCKIAGFSAWTPSTPATRSSISMGCVYF